jgi:imidazolonepropionase-like amidohydrolase
LVALVTIDAEFDHFEAIREGYEPALKTFVSRAAEDNMSALASMAARMSPPRKAPIAIVGGKLIDGTGREPIADAAVLIADGRIVAAGPRAQVKIPGNATRIDGTGKSVLPGLWDMHGHFQQVEWGPVYLAGGITTVRDNANEFEYIVAARNAIRDGRGLGPRLLLAGVVDGDSPKSLGVVRANTPEEAASVIAMYHKAGFEQVKIYSSVKPPIVKALADAAHRAGMTVTGHIPDGMTAFEAVNAGMDMISHLYPTLYTSAFPKDFKRMPGMMPAFKPDLPEVAEAAKFFREHGTILDPTMTVYELAWHTAGDNSFEPGIAKVAPELAESLKSSGQPAFAANMMRAGFTGGLAFLNAMRKGGIPIVAGTDQTVPAYSLYREMELYVQAGFTPMEAIQAATIAPARAMKLDRDSGTIEAGKRADLILVNGDPLRNISEIRRVERVIANGRLFETAPLWRSVGFEP